MKKIRAILSYGVIFWMSVLLCFCISETAQASSTLDTEVDWKTDTLTIKSDVPVYYCYMTLSEKAYTIKASKLKEVPQKSTGEYVVDFSSCSLKKNYYIGVTTEKKDITVDGFTSHKLTDAITQTVCNSNSDHAVTYVEKSLDDIIDECISSGDNNEMWNEFGEDIRDNLHKLYDGEKYYTCNGSTFDYVLEIRAYLSLQIPTVKKTSLNLNFDAFSQTGQMGESGYTTFSMPYVLQTYNNKQCKYKYSKSSLTYPNFNNDEVGGNTLFYKEGKNSFKVYINPLMFQYLYDNGKIAYGMSAYSYPSDNNIDDNCYDKAMWKNGKDGEWNNYKSLTNETLQEFAKTGATLYFKFYVGLQRYSNTVKLSIKKQVAGKAPNIKVNYSDATINISNGMQYSYDNVHWITIPYYYLGGYKKVSATNVDLRTIEGDSGYWNNNEKLAYYVSVGENLSTLYNSYNKDGWEKLPANEQEADDWQSLYGSVGDTTNLQIKSISLDCILSYEQDGDNYRIIKPSESVQNREVTIYVRQLYRTGKISSNTATVTIPKRNEAPKLQYTTSGDCSFVIDALTNADGSALTQSCEYCILYGNKEYSMWSWLTTDPNGSISWKAIKKGTKLNKKSYTTIKYTDEENDKKRTAKLYLRDSEWLESEENMFWGDRVWLGIRAKGTTKQKAFRTDIRWYIVDKSTITEYITEYQE
jgi:hypothetical protein